MEVSVVFKPASFGEYIPKEALFDFHEERLEAWKRQPPDEHATKLVECCEEVSEKDSAQG